MLKLKPVVLEAVLALGDPLPYPAITERKLRPLTQLSASQQERALHELLTDAHNRWHAVRHRNTVHKV